MSRRVVFAAMAVGLTALGVSAALDPAPILVWNATASAPLGLWLVAPGAQVGRGAWALVRPEPATANWLSGRGYLPPGVPLIKGVAAVGGQTVCRWGEVVLVDGRPAARAHRRDSRGRSLPRWRGCRRLGAHEVFLLNPHPGSLDGRYFGPTAAEDIVGPAILVWAR